MITETLLGPDFPGGGFLRKMQTSSEKFAETDGAALKYGQSGTMTKAGGCIEVTEIPYSTTIEAIMDKIVDGIKQGKLREISYVRMKPTFPV